MPGEAVLTQVPSCGRYVIDGENLNVDKRRNVR